MGRTVPSFGDWQTEIEANKVEAILILFQYHWKRREEPHHTDLKGNTCPIANWRVSQ